MRIYVFLFFQCADVILLFDYHILGIVAKYIFIYMDQKKEYYSGHSLRHAPHLKASSAAPSITQQNH